MFLLPNLLNDDFQHLKLVNKYPSFKIHLINIVYHKSLKVCTKTRFRQQEKKKNYISRPVKTIHAFENPKVFSPIRPLFFAAIRDAVEGRKLKYTCFFKALWAISFCNYIACQLTNTTAAVQWTRLDVVEKKIRIFINPKRVVPQYIEYPHCIAQFLMLDRHNINFKKNSSST